MDSVQELAHDGTAGLELLEVAVLDEVLVVGPDIGVMACGAERGHKEGDAQVTVAGLGPARLLVDAGAGLVCTWIESSHGDPLLGAHVVRQDQEFAEELNGTGGGDAGDADQEVEDVLELFVDRDDVADLAAQGLDLGFEVGDQFVAGWQ